MTYGQPLIQLQPGSPVRFEDALDVTPMDDGRNWQVLQNFYYRTDVMLWVDPVTKTLRRDRIVVPAGFITDFASIPRVLWNILPPTGKYTKAAVLHDWLYRTTNLATRKQADDVLLEAMKVCGVSWWQRVAIYSGVRVGGMSSYKGGL